MGRFTGIDPIAENFNWVTPYNYAENEPIAHIDLWGLQMFFSSGAAMLRPTISVPIEAASMIARPGISLPAPITIPAPPIITDGGLTIPTPTETTPVSPESTIAETTPEGVSSEFEVPVPEAVPDATQADILKPFEEPTLTQEEAESGTPRKKSSKQLRKEWEEIHKKPWPKTAEGRNFEADHDIPLADKGKDHGSNITPRTKKDHIKRHKDRGDFKRWAKRRKPKNNEADKNQNQ